MLNVYPLLENSWYPKNAYDVFIKHTTRIRFVDSFTNADAVWIMSYYLSTKKFFESVECDLESKYIMASIHHLTPWKINSYRDKLRTISEITKNIHVFSKKNLKEIAQYFPNSNMISLPYWVDEKQFYRKKLREDLRFQFNLPKNKILIGSFQRDTEADCITPKFEKGPDLFCDVLSYLDKSTFAVVLAGPRRDYIQKRLNEMRISTFNLGYVSHKDMNNLYNLIDLYLVTSRVEGGPQALIEAPLAGTAVFSTNVGVASEVCPEETTNDTKLLATKIQEADYSEIAARQHGRCLKKFSVNKVVRDYEEHFIKNTRHL